MPLHHLTGFEAYLLLAGCMTLPLCFIGILNFFVFQRPRVVVTDDAALPMISVLIPARDEERVIETCVRSLLRQNYPNFEVVVLDDNSSDATYDILCRLRDQDPRLRVLAGAALPEGWCGKPFACWQLAQAARGEYLLLTDADCEFSPDALLLAVGAVQEHSADVVSLSPDYIAISFWERLIIPLLVFIPLAFLPMIAIRHTRGPLFSGANGAFIFLPRATYLEIDGHRAVRRELAEDIKFAQHVKRSGKTIWYGSGDKAYRVRMYENLPQIWQGFTRNLFPAFSSSLTILTPALVYMLIVFILPVPLAALGYLIGAPWTLLALTPYLLVVLIRVMIALVLNRDRVEYALLNPLAWGVVLAIAIGSIVKHKSLGAQWKGRVYIKGQTRD